MPSVIEICNQALGNIGVQQTIASLDELSNEARACKRFYEQARNETLRARNWAFATRFVTLALIEADPNTEWGYSYRYPSDCSLVRRVIPSDVTVGAFYRDLFTIGSDSAGKIVYSNQVLAQAEITLKVSDTALFDDYFITALSWNLAEKIAPSLSGNKATVTINRAEAKYNKALEAAANAANNEEGVTDEPHSEFIRERE